MQDSIRATVIGSGAWGTALALVLAQNGHDVTIWSHDSEIANSINEFHENKQLFSGISLPENIDATTDLDAAVKDKKLIVLVVASAFFRKTLEQMLPLLRQDCILISATKGLDPASRKRPSQILEEALPDHLHEKYGILSGPNIAREIALGKPATTAIASYNLYTAIKAQQFFSTPSFRVYTNSDVIGTELGGTLKNIIAIAAGILDGLELGDNARAALLVRGMVEIDRFGQRFGARTQTLYGLAGMGDLITTCSSTMSRNHTVGTKLAAGQSLKEILESMSAVAEGVETARLVMDIAKKEGLQMPITAEVHAILFENKPVKEAIRDLMTRTLRSEGGGPT